jgi:hypothetical protein
LNFFVGQDPPQIQDILANCGKYVNAHYLGYKYYVKTDESQDDNIEDAGIIQRN